MPRYFFNLRRGTEMIKDEDGGMFSDVEAAYLEAFAAAKDLWPSVLARDEDPTHYAFEVTDEQNHHLFTLAFSEVLDAARKGRKRNPDSEM